MAEYQPLPEFDAIRRRQQGQVSQQRSEADNALKRRFASQGMLGSGAYQKSAELADESANRAAADAMSNIDMQEQAELQRRKEVSEGRQFTTGEREGAQRFAAEEAAKGRTFQTGERLGTQQFATGERLGSQQFATGERMGSQDFARGERIGTQDWQQGNLDREYQQNLLTNYINTILGMKDADVSSQDLNAIQHALAAIGYQAPSGYGVAPGIRAQADKSLNAIARR